MKIAASQVNLAANYSQSSSYTVNASLDAWRNKPAPAPQLSARGQALAAADSTPSNTSTASTASTASSDNNSLSANLQMLKTYLENILGHKIKLLNLSQLQAQSSSSQTASTQASASTDGSAEQGWGVDAKVSSETQNTQQVNFSAQGQIVTDDGQKLSFQLSFSLNQSVTVDSSAEVRLGDAALKKKDPLVVNYAAPTAALSPDTVNFDISSNGQPVAVHVAGPGSGLLALDKNGNGKVDNGSELFGAQSGDGFADLAKYDSDGNGWIDSNDPVYSQLRLWVHGTSGDQLLTLPQADVGAIFLGKTATPFTYDSAGNAVSNTNGSSVSDGSSPGPASGNTPTGSTAPIADLKTSGIFVSDSGTAGTVQQLDLYA